MLTSHGPPAQRRQAPRQHRPINMDDERARPLGRLRRWARRPLAQRCSQIRPMDGGTSFFEHIGEASRALAQA
jgi:hypothetical protein